MSTGKRYFDLKADYTRLEINVQESDSPVVVTGPVAVDSPSGLAAALAENPAVKEISVDEFAKATDFSKLTVAQLDDRFGGEDGYPVDGNKDAKVAFAKKSSEGSN
jgi:hypothetical protein